MLQEARRSWFYGLFAGYFVVAMVCSAVRPLWMDEVFQLVATSAQTVEDFMRNMGTTNPGAAPLGYLTQRPFVLAAGPVNLWVRFSSILFSILSCWALGRICRELRMPRVALLAIALFMAMPLQFRYATEGRPYEEALAFSLLAILGVLKLTENPSGGYAALTVCAMAAAVYTQPYAILNVAAVILWTAIASAKKCNWRAAVLGPVCLVVSIVAFVPWYILQTRNWATGIEQHGIPQFHWTLALLLDLFKGISGDGYLGSAALLILVTAAFLARPEFRWLLLAASILPIFGALAGDAFSNYFFAPRQILFALPGLVILAALGFLELHRRSKLAAVVAMAALVGAAVQKDVTMQRSRENWPAAAQAVADVARGGRCVEVVPATSLDLYTYFVPDLKNKVCDKKTDQPGAALISTIYTTSAELIAAADRFREQGFSPVQSSAIGGTTITLENR